MIVEPMHNDSKLIHRINEGYHYDPFMVLGRHNCHGAWVARSILPFAETAFIDGSNIEMERVADTDIFSAQGDSEDIPDQYQVIWIDINGKQHQQYDPYCFPTQLTDFDIHLFCEGRHRCAYSFMGSNPHKIFGISGTLFSVWAPNAERVSIVGDFNLWNGRCHPMRVRGSSGIWELFIPELEGSHHYKFEIRSKSNGNIFLKSDPYAKQLQLRPNTAAITVPASQFDWNDETWIEKRRFCNWLHEPLSIYEVHLGSWKRTDDEQFLNYRQLAHELVDYVKEMGFTYIELLPITEHPYDPSWGYQTTGYFAATSRYGDIDDFKYFVNYCHQNDIGVILDWAPGHFPKDDHALANFDGTPLYEHEDPRLGEHCDWGTLIFNYGRHEVRSFLISSAIYWLREMHLDGLRVDAVASMLYLDYSRNENEWLPNIYGGNENLEAISFLRELNQVTHSEVEGSLMMAEESTSWPQVTRPTWLGGLGFSMKWNMGWMHDTLKYYQLDPVHRHYHHDNLTFGLLYCYTENFLLPFSHDEVVHGKGSMINKMPGDEWQQFANLRLLYTYMFAYPGKKLLFMGSEFAQRQEWQYNKSLDWYVLDYAFHQGVQKLVKDLNKTYHQQSALHYYDFDHNGFEWLDCHDASQSVLSFIRRHDEEFLICIFNFTPVPRENYRIGVPAPGQYMEIHNSDSQYYCGSNIGNGLGLQTDDLPWMERPWSISLTLPPLSGIILKLKSG